MPPLTRSQRLFSNLLFLFVVATLTACSTPPKDARVSGGEAIAGRSSNTYIRVGDQGPVVVLQAGLQDGKEVWNKVLPKLSRSHTVIAFDRPGRNDSPATDAPRDPCTIAAEQRSLLRSAGIPPPYILVGHSLGGLYEYVYAKLYPSDVAGLVLLDPTHPHLLENIKRDVPSVAFMLNVARVVTFGGTDRREFDDQTICLDRLNLGQPLKTPSEILVSGRFRPEERGAFETIVKRLRQDWLKLTGAPKLDLILDSGHYIQKDNPDAVVAAVQQVTAAIRGR